MLRPHILIAALLAAPMLVSAASAQSGGSFKLDWNSLAGGGGTFSTGGSFRLGGTVGQPGAGPSTGGSFALFGGFWGRSPAAPVGVPAPELPRRFAMLAPSPNPFANATVIAFDLPGQAVVRLSVFALDGRRVVRLVDESLAPGRHRVPWNGCDAVGTPSPTGIYFVDLEAGASHAVSRVALVH